MADGPPTLIDVKAAAQILGVGGERVRQLARDGSLPSQVVLSSGGKKTFVFDRDAVLAHLAAQVSRATPDPDLARTVIEMKAEIRLLKTENARLGDDTQRLQRENARLKRALSALTEADVVDDVVL